MNKMFVVGIIAAVLLFPVAAMAGPSTTPGTERRKVVTRVSATEATIELSREDNAQMDDVTVFFSTTEGLLRVTYENTVGDTSHKKVLTTHLHELVEYTDDNGNQRFDAGEPVAGSWLMANASKNQTSEAPNGTLTWQPLTVSNVEADGKSGKKVSGRANFIALNQGLLPPLPLAPAPDRSMDLDIIVFGDFLQYEGTSLRPTEAKLDVRLLNYPFQRERTRLAMVMATNADDDLKEVRAIGAPSEQALVSTNVLGDRQVSLEFCWKETARVDGQDRPVGLNSLASEESRRSDSEGSHRSVEKVFAFEYDRGNEIVHDPSMGVDYHVVSESGGIFSGGKAPAPWVAGSLVAIAGAVVLLRRRQ